MKINYLEIKDKNSDKKMRLEIKSKFKAKNVQLLINRLLDLIENGLPIYPIIIDLLNRHLSSFEIKSLEDFFGIYLSRKKIMKKYDDFIVEIDRLNQFFSIFYSDVKRISKGTGFPDVKPETKAIVVVENEDGRIVNIYKTNNVQNTFNLAFSEISRIKPNYKFFLISEENQDIKSLIALYHFAVGFFQPKENEEYTKTDDVFTE